MINLENSFCIYCRGNLPRNSELNFHEGCQIEIDDEYNLQLKIKYGISAIEAEVLKFLDTQYSSPISVMSHSELISDYIKTGVIGYLLKNKQM